MELPEYYSALFRRVLYPGYESILRGRPTFRYLRYLEQTQWRSADEIHAVQSADLRRLLNHAYRNVPHYRKTFDAAGASVERVRTVEDLRALPILSRDAARAAGTERESTEYPKADIRKATGGTTGEPLLFGYNADSEYWRQAMKWRGYAWAGYRMGDRSFHYWGAPPLPLPPVRKLAKVAVDRYLKRERYADCGLRSDGDMQRAVDTIAREKPRAIVCYTQAGADLARYILDRGLRDWETIPVLCCAERLFKEDRMRLMAAFGPAVFETYGCREVMLIGAECEAHDGLHLSSENLIVELVVREGGRERAAEPGETGEVVITDLHNYGMPFIRYANGDLATAGPKARCACGRALARLGAVEGRSADTLRDGRGNRVGGLVFNIMFSLLAPSVRQFQAVQHQDGSITIKLVPARAIDDAARDLIRQNCEQYLPGVAIRTEIVPEIPTGKSGKRQVVVVER